MVSDRTDDEPLDPSHLREIVVAGAGLAATQTVAALRERGFDGRVVVLGAEQIAPYDRPPLSKHLLDRREPTWLTDEIGVDLLALADEVHLGTPARGLSLASGRPEVLTADGSFASDALVVATGAHAVRPPGWEAALTLHTAADAQRLREALVPGARLVVIGAGWIGAEVAGVAAAAGVEVVVLEATGAPLAGALGAAVGDVALRRSPRHGWVPGGHWDGALRAPAGLVAALLGTPQEAVEVAPYVFSTQLGHEIALFGQPHADDEVVLRGDPAGDGWAALWFRRRSDEVAAILTVDRPRDVGAARRLFTGARLPRLDRTVTRDPGRPLREAVVA